MLRRPFTVGGQSGMVERQAINTERSVAAQISKGSSAMRLLRSKQLESPLASPDAKI